ncbi:prisilkin-39-like, partial [Anopheles cruzii]|uniref:prisilkin-39-like n=1 Tax=Anopheles cruzii TaxID=68878 RepID=UPI0022EC95A6
MALIHKTMDLETLMEYLEEVHDSADRVTDAARRLRITEGDENLAPNAPNWGYMTQGWGNREQGPPRGSQPWGYGPDHHGPAPVNGYGPYGRDQSPAPRGGYNRYPAPLGYDRYPGYDRYSAPLGGYDPRYGEQYRGPEPYSNYGGYGYGLCDTQPGGYNYGYANQHNGKNHHNHQKSFKKHHNQQ